MRKAEFEQKYLGERVQIELFNGRVLTGFLEKTGDERFKTGYGAERNGAECDRLWCVCRYRCASGWTRAYFPDVRQIHQASAGGCIGWRYRGCDGNECRSGQASDTVIYDKIG